MADDKDNIVLFPTNRIKNPPPEVDPKVHKKIVDEQTKEFVEGTVDDIAYMLLDKFISAGVRTKEDSFTQDLALVIDSIRGLVYRDFKKYHPAQALSDKMVQVKINKNGNKTARLHYGEVLDTKHKPHKPLSKDIEDEVRDIADMGDIEFTPEFDFDPDNDNKWEFEQVNY